jgi:hypothetical protein
METRRSAASTRRAHTLLRAREHTNSFVQRRRARASARRVRHKHDTKVCCL